MTPERLEELAAMSDPDKLWQLASTNNLRLARIIYESEHTTIGWVLVALDC